METLKQTNKFGRTLNLSQQGIEGLGQTMFETMHERYVNRDVFSRREYNMLKEQLGKFTETGEYTSKEDLTFSNNTQLYTTLVASFVDQKVRPKLLAEGVIKTARVSATGASGYKIPVNSIPTAQALPDSGDVSYEASVDYGGSTITLGWIYSAQKITQELIAQSNIDVIQDQIGLLGYAISKKMDSDILAAMETASPNTNTNSNYEGLGANNLTYSDMISGITGAMGNNVEPTHVLMPPATLKNLMQDTNMITALGYNSVQQGTLFPMLREILGVNVIVSNQVSANNVLIVDSNVCGYLLEGSSIEVYDGRPGGTVSQEVIATKLYGVSVVQPEAVYRIEEQTA